jgi:hypothetical protein
MSHVGVRSWSTTPCAAAIEHAIVAMRKLPNRMITTIGRAAVAAHIEAFVAAHGISVATAASAPIAMGDILHCQWLRA